jgi:transcriptional regulator with GAF, ATPase, and Fis domain
MTALASVRPDSVGIPGSEPLAFMARRAAVAPAAPIVVDTSAALLQTIAEVLDIRSVFPRVSEIVKPMLPHDALGLMFQDRGGQITMEASSSDDLAAHAGWAGPEDEPFYIVSDLRRAWGRLAIPDQRDFLNHLLDAGYRSILTVRSGARHQVMLGFFARRPDAFGLQHVPTAQRLADCLAVAVAHEQLAAVERDRAEARGRTERLDARVRAVADKGAAPSTHHPIVGRSDAWQAVLEKALRVATTETTVFLQGESGTGKEVVARFIHHMSPRKDGPFVAINCAALPEQLLESELFGYERGAFTGAHQAKAGQIELAAHGVLFLDEVSEMSPTAQAKFLRFLQEREFQRLGGTRTQKADVRVIAASNRDLRLAVEKGTFREDLFYRLQVFDIPLPPLRERLSDVPLLAERFLEELGRSMGRAPARLAEETREALMTYRWPGNVRELRNVLERAAILSDEGLIERRHLSLQPPTAATSSRDLVAMERGTIEAVLRETDGNKSKTARRLGLSRTQLYVRLRRYGIEHAEMA